MIILLSPSKTQDFDAATPKVAHTVPPLLDESARLIGALRRYSEAELAALMEISAKLAALNHTRYRAFKTPFTPSNAKPALFAFQGDVYDGLEAASLSKKEVTFAQKHLRILSGLYGMLRPLDLIQPYRLEMKTRLKNPRGKDLYAFWGNRLDEALQAELNIMKHKIIINLASEEYFKALHPEALDATLISPQFKEKKDGTYKIIGLFAKKARGRMARYLIAQGANAPDALTTFTEDGYRYNQALSSPEKPVFTR